MTGAGTASAVDNFDALAESIEQTNETIAASDSGGVSSLIGGLFSVSGLATIAATAFAGFGIAVATNAFGIRDSIAEVIEDLSNTTINWGDVWQETVKGIVTGFAIVEYSFTNWQTVGDHALVSIELAAVRFGAQVTHLFTEVIPKTLRWLWDNWRDIWQTMWDFTRTVVENLYENLVDFFANVILWLSGEQTDFKWTGLTEGFKSSIKELPDILEREKGPLEQQLEQMQQDLADGIVNGADENIRKRVGQIPDLMAAIKSGLTSAAGGADDFLGHLFGATGGKGNARIDIDLPTLESDRFTTGVQASAQEDLKSELAMLNQSVAKNNDIMDRVATWMEGKLPREMRDAVRAGTELAKSKGYTLGK
jgi:hypothetical protein